MMNRLCVFIRLGITCGIMLLGCSSSQQTQKPPRAVKSLAETRLEEIKRDEALRHFINGAALDAKNQYAEAILEYQEALDSDKNASIYYAISRDYAFLNKNTRAAEFGKESVRLEPTNITYRENLASVYISAYEINLAIAEYEEIVKIDSNNSDEWLTLARLYQQTKPLQALEIFEKILDREGDQFDILFQCASLYSTLGKYDQAALKYKRMLELDPSNKPLQKQLADAYAKAGKLEDAAKILQSMIEVDQSDPEVLAALADIYLSQKEFKRAIALYEKLLGQGIANQEVKLRIGVGFFGLTEHDSTASAKARKIFDELVNSMPNDWRPHWYLGAIAANAKNDSLASIQFDIVTKLAQWNADAWWFLGSTLFEQGKYATVLEAMNRAEKAVPKDFRIYLLEGLVYSRLDQTEKAIERLEIAYTLNPKDINTISSLALAYDGLHQYHKSDSLYEEALRIDPKSAIVLNNYGYSLSERSIQLQRALGMAKEAVSSEPNNSAYLDTYGWVLYKLEQYPQAAEYIEKSIAAGSASAVVHEHLGDIYFKMGKKEKAITIWRKALEMNSKNEYLRNKIERGSL